MEENVREENLTERNMILRNPDEEDAEKMDEVCKRLRLSEEITNIKSRAAGCQEQARSLYCQADVLGARARSLGIQVSYLRTRADFPEVRSQREKAQKEAAEKLVHGLFRDILAVVTDGKLRLCETAEDLPPVLELPCEAIPLTRADGLRELRRQARQEALGLGLPEERWGDLLTASQEAAMNAVVHAGGGTGRISTNGQNTVQARVEDQGRGIDVERLPRALLEKGYSTAGTFGFGMKMMILSADRVWLLTGPAGTTVVLEQDRTTPLPPWL